MTIRSIRVTGQHRDRGQKRQLAAFRLEFRADRRAGKRGHGLAYIHGARRGPGLRGQRRGALRADRVHAGAVVFPGGPQPRHDKPDPRTGLRDGAQADGDRGSQRLGRAVPVRQHDPGGGRAGRQR